MYDIKVDPRVELIDVKLGGMMTVAEVDAYICDLKAAFIRYRLRSFAMIIDVTACPIQQQDMLRAMGEHMRSMPKSRAIAIVTGSSLARMQVRRLFTQPYARIVATSVEGYAWAIDGIEPETTAPAARAG